MPQSCLRSGMYTQVPRGVEGEREVTPAVSTSLFSLDETFHVDKNVPDILLKHWCLCLTLSVTIWQQCITKDQILVYKLKEMG